MLVANKKLEKSWNYFVKKEELWLMNTSSSSSFQPKKKSKKLMVSNARILQIWQIVTGLVWLGISLIAEIFSKDHWKLELANNVQVIFILHSMKTTSTLFL